MESICSSCSAFSGTHLFPLTSRVNLLSLTSSRYSSNLNFFRRKHRHFRRFRGESSDKRRILIQTTKNFGTFASTAFFSDSKSIREDSSVSFPVNFPNAESNLLESVRKAIVLAVFFVAVGFLPNRILLRPAIAAVSVVSREEVRRKEEESNIKDHEYSDYTRRLLETVSRLIQKIGEVRLSKGDLKGVKEALKEVNSKRKELQEEILKRLNAELRELRGEKAALVKQSGDIIDSVLRVKKEQEKLSRKLGGREKLKKQTETLEESMIASEKEYNAIWEKVSGIEDKMLRRETMAFSVGIRELSFIERESELLVERFNRELRRRRVEKHGLLGCSATKLSRSDIQRELETAKREYWEQMILPNVLEVEDSGIFLDQSTKEFVSRIKRAFKESEDLQKNLEFCVRKNMKQFGDENRFIVNTPVDEVVKGFPEIELKWMFGNKEVVVPEAIGLHLYHGWKKWREEAKADLKRNLLENVDLGKRYVTQRQERILLDRDRVVAKTWYNEEKNRWEMDSIAVPYAVSKKLVENVRIRHDWAAMYIALKGDDKEYYVDIQEFEMLFEDFGGFDGLYLKMLASGIPTAVQLMHIPLSELDIRQQFFLAMRLSRQCLVGLWKSGVVQHVKRWVFEKIKNINDDIMMMIIFPIVEFIIPFPVRMNLGMAWPEDVDQATASTWYLKWQSDAEINFKSRKGDDIQWFLWFLIRSIVYGYVLFNVLRFLKRKIPRFLGYGPLRRNPNLRKLRRVKAYFRFKLRRRIRRKKEGIDPIRSAFDQMKRVKNPPIRLKDFASVESMREEINEVVAFLQNPSAFREMGACAPRGFEKQDGVVLMATTRNLKQIDQALQRPGRMDRIFHLQRPTQLEREKILRIAAKESMDHELIELVDWKKVAEKTALLRPVELKLVPLALEGSAFRSKFLDTDELISYCGWFASFSDAVPKWLREIKIVKGISRWLVNHLGLTLTKDDMQNVVDLMEPYGQISNGIELLNPPLDWTRETKFPHAVWAAGRGLIALILPNFDVVDNIWLEPFSWEGIGCTKITKAKDEESMNGNVETRSYLEKKLVFCFGSYVAAQMLLPFGEENFLSSSELKQAQEIATRMVIQYGWGPDESPTIYFCSNATTALSMGNNHEFEMAAKVEKIYDSAYDKAKNMLQKNRKVLEKIVEELLEFEILTGKDLQRIFYENGGIQEKEPFFLSNLYDKELESSYSVDGRNASATALLGLAT
uniref:Peptidase M41 domain-containing protein n=1 Tax=Nelumbo nucifera TaxID=4432 RepID=A0A822YKP1_NELNU|nr:TPA_asm: hypothetical protein HUJ06_012011 [Nelumbo nucifera]